MSTIQAHQTAIKILEHIKRYEYYAMSNELSISRVPNLANHYRHIAQIQRMAIERLKERYNRLINQLKLDL